MILNFLMIIIAYLIGSISCAIIVCKIFNLPDPRTTGSNNPGASNVLRLGGKDKAAMVLVGDVLKGFIPTLLAVFSHFSPHMVAFTALAAVLGHVFPIYYGFKGGKGVATAIGGYLGINLILGILVAVIWFIVSKIYHYSSLASLSAIIAAPILARLFFHGGHYILPLLIITIIVIVKHCDNIRRLRAGTEPKIGDMLAEEKK